MSPSPESLDYHSPEGSPSALLGATGLEVQPAVYETGAVDTANILSRLGEVGVGTLAPAEDAEVPPVQPAPDVYKKQYDEATGEVHITSQVTLEDYERITPPQEMALLKDYSKAMEGKRLAFVNATHTGGGVAIMRAPLIHLLRSAGVDAHWYVLKPDDEAFKITKGKFHNVLQNVAEPGVRLNGEDKEKYESWMGECAEMLKQPLSEADAIIIDDPQPSGLIPYIKGYQGSADNGGQHQPGFNPDAPLLFRDHIQTEGELMVTPGTPQYDTWQYIWQHNRVNEADVVITHPVDAFVPPNVPDEKVAYMPATCELLDDLNRRPITGEEEEQGFAFINEQLAQNEGQEPLDRSRPYVALIARFDPSKGMPEGMQSYALAREKMLAMGVSKAELPQFVMLGNGSVDDPDGVPVLADIMRRRAEYDEEVQKDMKIVRVPHNDLAINTLLGGSSLAMQPSTKEGFESRVTDAILQGVPVLGSNRGGIPLQIKDGESGYVMDPYNTEQWSDRIAELMGDPAKYQGMRQRTKELAKEHNYQFTTVPNAISWLHLSHTLLTAPEDFKGNRQWVSSMSGSARAVPDNS